VQTLDGELSDPAIPWTMNRELSDPAMPAISQQRPLSNFCQIFCVKLIEITE